VFTGTLKTPGVAEFGYAIGKIKIFLTGFMGKYDKDLFDEAAVMRYKTAKVYRLFDVGSPSRDNS